MYFIPIEESIIVEEIVYEVTRVLVVDYSIPK